MRCERCNRDFDNGLANCPHCGAEAHYAGKTDLYDKALKSELSIKDLFSDTFKSHSIGAMEKLLTVGTKQTTPSKRRMILEWDKPWLYMRVLVLGLVFVALVNIMKMEGLREGHTLMATFPVFIMPLTVLTFFWEINIPRNISIFKVLGIFLIGGMLATMSIPFLGHGMIPEDAAQYAAFTEEPAKLLVTALFIYFMNPRYIFNGLLIGAAVGAGFGAFESFDYVLHSGEHYLAQMIYRSVNIFGTHLMWAAIEGGALVMVKQNETLQFKHFVDLKFLPYLATSVALHFVGNYNFGLMKVPFFADLKYVLMCLVAVGVVGDLVNKAIIQVLEIANTATPVTDSQPLPREKTAVLTALEGPLKGKSFPIQGNVLIGRNFETCNIIFPNDTRGVSRKHCKLEVRADGVYLMDVGSTSGTFFQGQKKPLPANQWIKVTENFYLGSPAVMFSVSFS